MAAGTALPTITKSTPGNRLASAVAAACSAGPSGNVTSYAYDADGRLDTVTLENYTGDPANPSSPQNLVESSRAYDPAGRLASVTDSMGWVTSYGYTDDGLIASVTRSDPSTGASFTEQANTYDAAGNQVAQVTGNGATTTDYTVDAADQVTSQTLDPAGLDRVTGYTYSADDYVTAQTLTGAGSSTPVRSESWAYDPMGNITGQTVDLQGTSNPVTTTWTLDQRGVPTSMTDPRIRRGGRDHLGDRRGREQDLLRLRRGRGPDLGHLPWRHPDQLFV